MRSWFRSRPATLLAGALCAGLVATWAVGKVLDKREESRRDQHEVARMTDKMKTVCVGRFLIDVPEAAEIELGQAHIDGFHIAAFSETEQDFQKRLADREAQIKAKPDHLGGNKNMEAAREVTTSSGLIGKIFIHSRTVEEGTQGNGLGGVERYRDEGVTTEALVHGHGISIDLFFEDRNPDLIEDLPRLVNQLVANPNSLVPSEPGFCMDRVYARDPLSADQREQIMMFGRLPNHPDVEIMFIVSAGLKPDARGVLARTEAADGMLSLAGRMRVTKLRAAPREIGGLPGEEVAEVVVEENEARGHSFWWEVNGTEDNVFVPHVVFRMSTGNGNRRPVPSSLSDGAALGLWDKISSSIRLRPTKPVQTALPRFPTTNIGAFAMAGERCPHSGWWLCGDGGNGIGVLGGQRQYFNKGDRMPQALLLPPQTLWEKVRGIQPSFEPKTRTSWKLSDKRARERRLPSLPLAEPKTVAVTETPDANSLDSIEVQLVTIGAVGATGSPCPASGWWRCEEPQAVDGTRWFARGSLLPPVTVPVPPDVFGRAARAPTSIQRRGVWRLMRLAEQRDVVDPGETNAAPQTGQRPAQDT